MMRYKVQIKLKKYAIFKNLYARENIIICIQSKILNTYNIINLVTIKNLNINKYLYIFLKQKNRYCYQLTKF